MAKEGSTVSGLMDSFATAVSLALQHGVQLKVLCEKFAHSRFEPSGWTGSEQIGYAKSIMDYIFRWLQLRFLSGQQLSLFAGLAGAASPQNVILSEAERSGAESKDPFLSPEQHAFHARHGSNISSAGGILSNPHVRLDRERIKDGRPRHLPRCRRHERPVRHGRRSQAATTCGAIMVRNGSCYRCMSCGSTSGCS